MKRLALEVLGLSAEPGLERPALRSVAQAGHRRPQHGKGAAGGIASTIRVVRSTGGDTTTLFSTASCCCEDGGAAGLAGGGPGSVAYQLIELDSYRSRSSAHSLHRAASGSSQQDGHGLGEQLSSTQPHPKPTFAAKVEDGSSGATNANGSSKVSSSASSTAATLIAAATSFTRGPMSIVIGPPAPMGLNDAMESIDEGQEVREAGLEQARR